MEIYYNSSDGGGDGCSHGCGDNCSMVLVQVVMVVVAAVVLALKAICKDAEALLFRPRPSSLPRPA